MMKRIRVPHHYAREARGGLATQGVTLAENASGKKRHAAVGASPDQGELTTSQVQSTSPRLLRFTVVNTNPFISTSDRTTTSYTCGARLAARRTRRGIGQKTKRARAAAPVSQPGGSCAREHVNLVIHRRPQPLNGRRESVHRAGGAGRMHILRNRSLDHGTSPRGRARRVMRTSNDDRSQAAIGSGDMLAEVVRASPFVKDQV
jgi:hypothetical protein